MIPDDSETENVIPDDVIQSLLRVAKSGLVNMLDFHAVCALIAQAGAQTALNWLKQNRGRYMEALNQMGSLWRGGTR